MENQRRRKRPVIMDKILWIYSGDGSRIPVSGRASFSDGTTARYDLHQDQPAPLIAKCVEIIREWKVGYPPRRDQQ